MTTQVIDRNRHSLSKGGNLLIISKLVDIQHRRPNLITLLYPAKAQWKYFRVSVLVNVNFELERRKKNKSMNINEGIQSSLDMRRRNIRLNGSASNSGCVSRMICGRLEKMKEGKCRCTFLSFSLFQQIMQIGSRRLLPCFSFPNLFPRCKHLLHLFRLDSGSRKLPSTRPYIDRLK